MKYSWTNAIIVFGFLLMCCAASAEVDITTGEPVPMTMRAMSAPGSVCSVDIQTCAALWDISHGVYLSYEPSGAFSDFVGLLNTQGYPVAVTSTGILSEDLSKYKILIISTSTSWDSAYTPAEVAAIRTFVDNGGKLLILAENTECPNDNINPVSQEFGTTAGVSYLSPLDLTITDFDAHPAFSGVSSLLFRAGGELRPALPAVTIARTDDSLPAITVAESNRVIVIGDSNIFDNTYLGTNDNQKLALNLWKDVYCPAVPEFPSIFLPISFIIGVLGAVFLIQSRKSS